MKVILVFNFVITPEVKLNQVSVSQQIKPSLVNPQISLCVNDRNTRLIK